MVCLLTATHQWVAASYGIRPIAEDVEITEKILRMMVDAGSEKGKIHLRIGYIQNVLEFDDKTAEEVMTHRTEVSCFGWTRTI